MDPKENVSLPRLILLTILIIAICFGFYFYSGYFESRNPMMWIFLPNSPMAILASLIVIFVYKKSDLLNFIACVYVGKFGVWTVFVMLLYPEVYLRSGILGESIILYIIPHIAMVFLALLHLPNHPKPKSWHLAAVLLFFLANDYANYFGGVMTGPPPIIPLWQIDFVRDFSIGLTVFFSLFYFFFSEKIGKTKATRNVNKTLG